MVEIGFFKSQNITIILFRPTYTVKVALSMHILIVVGSEAALRAGDGAPRSICMTESKPRQFNVIAL